MDQDDGTSSEPYNDEENTVENDKDKEMDERKDKDIPIQNINFSNNMNSI